MLTSHHWHNPKSVISFWVWKFPHHQLNDSKSPKLRNKLKNNHNSRPPQRVQPTNMVTKLSHQPRRTMKRRRSARKRNGVFVQFRLPICICVPITFMSVRTTSKKLATHTFYRRYLYKILIISLFMFHTCKHVSKKRFIFKSIFIHRMCWKSL